MCQPRDGRRTDWEPAPPPPAPPPAMPSPPRMARGARGREVRSTQRETTQGNPNAALESLAGPAGGAARNPSKELLRQTGCCATAARRPPAPTTGSTPVRAAAGGVARARPARRARRAPEQRPDRGLNEVTSEAPSGVRAAVGRLVLRCARPEIRRPGPLWGCGRRILCLTGASDQK